MPGMYVLAENIIALKKWDKWCPKVGTSYVVVGKSNI
jgi:hypothetical protein